MEAILLELLQRLEAVGSEHEELFDTAVRDELDDAVARGFLKPQVGYVLPVSFAMYSKEADRLVSNALAWFLPAANEAAKRMGLDTFHRRLDALQNLEVRTELKNDYNDFFGWANPELFDEQGNAT